MAYLFFKTKSLEVGDGWRPSPLPVCLPQPGREKSMLCTAVPTKHAHTTHHHHHQRRAAMSYTGGIIRSTRAMEARADIKDDNTKKQAGGRFFFFPLLALSLLQPSQVLMKQPIWIEVWNG